MPEFTPDVVAQISYPSLTDGFPDTPPILLHSFAEDWHRDSGSHTTGAFQKATSTHEGQAVIVNQDTTLTTGKNIGRTFSAISGSSNLKDDLTDPKSGKYKILQQNETLDTTWAILDSSAYTAGMRRCMIDLLRGFPSTDSSSHSRANTYLYVELNNGSTDGNYRLAFEWGERYRLEYSNPKIASGAWRTVQTATDVFDHGSKDLNILVEPDAKAGHLRVTINEKNVLVHGDVQNVATERHNLPSTERFYIYGKNCWHTVAVHKVRYRSLEVKPVPKSLGIPVATDQARVIANRCGQEPTGQVNSHTVSQDADGNLAVESSASLADAGEGSGSAEPPKFSDILIYIPSQWRFYAGTAPIANLRVVHVREQQVWDDNRRYGYTTGSVVSQNYDGASRGAYGHFSLSLMASNGYRTRQRLRGLMGVGTNGHSLSDWGTGSVVASSFYDNTWKMMSPLCYEIVLDGLCLFTAVRLACEAGSIHPSFLRYIPDTGFPPYDDSMPYPILATGLGNSPRHKYTPEVSPLDIVLDLIRTYGDVTKGSVPGDFRSTPYYFFQDSFGNMHCEPYNAALYPPAKEYSTVVPSGYDPNYYGLIEDEITVTSDITNMRTELNIQGLDPINNNLLNYHRQLTLNREVVGYRSALLDRDPRYVSDAAMARAAKTHSFIASLPVQYVQFRTAFDPFVFAGQNVIVSDYKTLGRRGVFTIVNLENFYGLADQSQQSGQLACTSLITARSAESGIVP